MEKGRKITKTERKNENDCNNDKHRKTTNRKNGEKSKNYQNEQKLTKNLKKKNGK